MEGESTETVAIMAGTTSLGWRKVLIATTIGAAPPAFVYAIAGEVTDDFTSGFVVATVVILLAGIAWLVGKRYIESASNLRTE